MLSAWSCVCSLEDATCLTYVRSQVQYPRLPVLWQKGNKNKNRKKKIFTLFNKSQTLMHNEISQNKIMARKKALKFWRTREAAFPSGTRSISFPNFTSRRSVCGPLMVCEPCLLCFTISSLLSSHNIKTQLLWYICGRKDHIVCVSSGVCVCYLGPRFIQDITGGNGLVHLFQHGKVTQK